MIHVLARREQLLHDVKAGVEQLDRGEYSEYGEGSLQEFLADIEAEEQARFRHNYESPAPGKLSETLLFEKDIVSPLGKSIW